LRNHRGVAVKTCGLVVLFVFVNTTTDLNKSFLLFYYSPKMLDEVVVTFQKSNKIHVCNKLRLRCLAGNSKSRANCGQFAGCAID
jgi:hypothetical protein